MPTDLIFVGLQINYQKPHSRTLQGAAGTTRWMIYFQRDTKQIKLFTETQDDILTFIG